MAETQVVEIDQIKGAPFNPPNRVEERKLKDLMHSIERVGLLYPLLVTPELELIDGHRRLTCLRKLGRKTAEVLVASGNRQQLWSEVNSHTAPIRAASWWQAAALGLELEHIRPQQRKLIEEARRWMGVEASNELALEHSKSTDVVRQAIKVARYIDDDSDTMKARILMWIVKHDMSFNVHNFMLAHQPSEVLAQAIMEDKEVRQGWALV